ncbi:MAG: efflux RND transporter periplasmic adaptor subunit [Oligoflexia bacterium]|nr:efflux RND transporter periplasmic adaptor subunit [Oligoflexia bacterium]
MKAKKIIAPLFIILTISAGFIYHKVVNKEGFYYSGTVEATKIDLSSRLQSVVEKIYVDEGDEIKVGSPLVKLSCEDIIVALRQSKQDFERGKRLFKEKSIPQDRFEHLQTSLDDLTIKNSWCEIASPIGGTILNKYKEPAEYVFAGTKLLTVANLDEVWATFYLPEKTISQLKLKTEVLCYISELNMKEIKGVIRKISEQAEFTPKNVQTREERTRLLYGVKIYFNNKERILKPGMNLEIKFPEQN